MLSKIAAVAKEKGADLVGFADVRDFPGGEEDQSNPCFYLADAKTVIVLALKIVDALWDKLSGDYDVHSTNAINYLRHYNYDLLDYIAVQTARFIEEQGYDAYPVQARTESKRENVFIGYFPFKAAARLAGLGVPGKHDMIITPEFGPRARLVAIITNVPYEEIGKRTDLPRSTDELCGKCKICIDRCPVQAISYSDGVSRVDRRKCQGYMDVAQNCILCQGICTKGREAAARRRRRRPDGPPSR